MKAAFPSARQAACAGLRKQFYPASVRDLVDYDYADGLPAEAKQWLAAFSEEHYRGWRLSRETQVTRIEHIREADASLKRVLRGADGMAVKAEALGGAEEDGEMALLAGVRQVNAAELRARNHVEDEVVEALDRGRKGSSKRALGGRRA